MGNGRLAEFITFLRNNEYKGVTSNSTHIQFLMERFLQVYNTDGKHIDKYSGSPAGTKYYFTGHQ